MTNTKREIVVQTDQQTAMRLRREFRRADLSLMQWFAPLTVSDIRVATPKTGSAQLSDEELIKQRVADEQLQDKFFQFLNMLGKLSPYQRDEIWDGRAEGLVCGHYVVEFKCGKGGQAQVYKAYDTFTESPVAKAIKVYDVECAPARFQREVVALTRLKHENVVGIEAYDQRPVMLVMEFVDATNLHEHAKVVCNGNGSVPSNITEQDAVDWIRQAACGLKHAHDQGVIHRDVKPANLLLDKSGKVRVADWGLAKLDGNRPTITGGSLGTPYWESPEQARNPHHVDYRSDIYSLGATLFSILTGTVMYSGSPADVQMGRETMPPPSIGRYRPVGELVERLYEKMVRKDPNRRLGPMDEVIGELERCLR